MICGLSVETLIREAKENVESSFFWLLIEHRLPYGAKAVDGGYVLNGVLLDSIEQNNGVVTLISLRSLESE